MKRKQIMIVLATMVLVFTMCSCIMVQCGANAGTGDFEQNQSQDLGLWGDPVCIGPILLGLVLCLLIGAGAGMGGR